MFLEPATLSKRDSNTEVFFIKSFIYSTPLVAASSFQQECGKLRGKTLANNIGS